MKCRCGPVVAPFVGFPLLSLYLLFGTSYTFLGPTEPIICPCRILSPSVQRKTGDK